MKNLNKHLKKASLIVVILSITLGIYLRFENLQLQSFWMDEGFTINAIKTVIENNNTKLNSGEVYHCATYCYPSAYISKIFGQNSFSYRFLAAISGIFSIFIIYKLALILFNKNTALLSSVFISLSYWQIAWSRQARWYTLFALFFYLSIYFFYDYLKTKQNKKIIISTIFVILSIITHRLAFLLPFIFIIIALLNAKKIRKKNLFLSILISLSAILIVEIIFNFQISKTLIENTRPAYSLPYYLKFYLINYHLFLFLAILGYFNIKTKEIKIFFLSLIIPYIIIIAFFSKTVNFRYFFHLTPLLYILSAYAIIFNIQKLKKKHTKYLTLIIIFAFFFLSGNGIMLPKKFYFLESDFHPTKKQKSIPYTPQPNFNEAYRKIQDLKKEEEIVISAYPQFNKIFLNEPGYWIKFNYSEQNNNYSKIKNDKENYVGAQVADNLDELKNITSNKNGYILLDQMSIDGRIDSEITDYISKNFNQIFYEYTNVYSKIWVFEF